MSISRLYSYFVLLTLSCAAVMLAACSDSDSSSMDGVDQLESTPFTDDEQELTPFVLTLDDDGFHTDGETTYAGGAPFKAHFEVVAENAGDYDIRYEWQFIRDGQQTPFLTRYEQSTDYTFVMSGTFYVKCLVSIVNGDDVLEYEMDSPIVINIASSKLEMPNTFTPNDDGINDTLRVKEGYISIIEFHAAIFTRSGTKLYEWTNPADGWDGTMNGHGGTPAPDGAYYLLLRARGADGLKYDRKMTIHLLREFDESTTGAG